MRGILFFSRVAFICNVCFAITWLLRYYPSLQQGHAIATIIILGIVVAGGLNLLVNLFVLVYLLQQKPVAGHFPRWLISINFLFLIVQLILFFK